MREKALSIEALDGETISWQKADSRYLKYRLVHTMIGFAVLALILGAAFAVLAWLLPAWGLNTQPLLDWLNRPLLWGLISAFIVIEIAIEIFVTFRFVKSLAFAERDDDFLIRYGVMVHRMWAVPYGRIQSVEVRSGPLERAFGLAQLQIRTAGHSGQITLPGLSTQKADQFREGLVARGQARLAGL